MSESSQSLFMIHNMPSWVTIPEAAEITMKTLKRKIIPGDIYRHALSGNILLSIYFQSPVIIKKIQTFNGKIKFRQFDGGLIDKLCQLDKNGFIYEHNLTLCTEGKYIHPIPQIIDTPLMGYEYVLIQRILAHELKFPLPVTGAKELNYGITVKLSGSIFQTFEKMTWEKRVENQLGQLPKKTAINVMAQLATENIIKYRQTDYFPLYNLPSDACFVIRYAEVEKLINLYKEDIKSTKSSPRITTPLSRLFWLACKHNDTISPLLKPPYKLLSIFEQWASDDGIKEELNAETLKRALERGSPSSTSLFS